MTEKPITMTPGNIVAIDEGRKGMTRRRTGLKEINKDPDQWAWMSLNGTTQRAEMLHENGEILDVFPPFRRGDKLWLKEQWATIEEYDHLKPSELPDGAEIWFPGHIGWGIDRRMGRKRSARFMPKKYTRKWLMVTEVKAPERVQIISPQDIRSEGVIRKETTYCYLAVEMFERLWESIHGNGSWDKNEWVWPIAFEKIEARKKVGD